MDRMKNILNDISSILYAQKTYDGKKRSELKNSDFLFPETKSFPIVSPSDVKDAISNFGRMDGKIDYDSFLHKLYNMCKRKGSEFVAALPEASKEKLGIKDSTSNADIFDLETSMPSEDDMQSDSSDMSSDSPETEIYNMSVTSLKAICDQVSDILNAIELNNEQVKENLTEPWLYGKLAVVADYIQNVHHFLMFYQESDDKLEVSDLEAKQKIKKELDIQETGLPTNTDDMDETGG